ncbi:MAG: glycosyltransferase family 2 protein [Bacteroidales bacterium]|nr:glycosyltransferase family 2 protein [Bacteroidales bacterium]
MDVSIILVNYNTCDLTRDCLKSVFAQTKDIDFEVIVSDNGSKDGSVEMITTEFPQVILIENNANLGFGAANNRGLKIAKGKYIFYLNSDTILLNNAVKLFFDYWEKSPEKDKIGALGGNLLNEKGEVIHSGGNLPIAKAELISFFTCILSSIGLKKLFFKFGGKAKIHSLYEGEIGYVIGADLFMLNDDNAKFDANYFMYYEESDLQFHLQQKGKKSFLISEPQIIHLEGGSDKKDNSKYDFSKKTSKYYWESCCYYLEKNLKAKFAAGIIKNWLRVIYR